MTLAEAKALKRGQIIYMRCWTNADGLPTRWRVNGMAKTWKRSPERVQVPIKHGLYSYGYLTDTDLNDLCLTEEEATT
jgi:hypothetical protein